MRIQHKGGTVEVGTYRTFGQTARRYKWFDFVDTKRKANDKAKQLRKQGALVRIVPQIGGYSIYTSARVLIIKKG